MFGDYFPVTRIGAIRIGMFAGFPEFSRKAPEFATAEMVQVLAHHS